MDDPVDLGEESSRIIVEPLNRRGFQLAELLDGITNEIVHRETDVESPVGNEVW
jgi:antitoxin component of MazEF toxin-antitoxin module